MGDLVTLEMATGGLAGIVIWGLHRDTVELLEIGLPFFSLGALPTGPLSLDKRSTDALDCAHVGEWTVTPEDVVVGDGDGVIFLPYERLVDIIPVAESIRETERRQAGQMRSGSSFREQAAFTSYLAQRAQNPEFGFREHLRQIGGAIEE